MKYLVLKIGCIHLSIVMIINWIKTYPITTQKFYIFSKKTCINFPEDLS